MLIAVITGGRGTGRTGRAAKVRAQAAAGLPGHVPHTRVHDLGPIAQVVEAGDGVLPAGDPVSVFEVSAYTSSARPQVWLCLVWGYVGDRLVVVDVEGDTRGGVREHASMVAADLELSRAGMVCDGGSAEAGTSLCVTLAAVTVHTR